MGLQLFGRLGDIEMLYAKCDISGDDIDGNPRDFEEFVREQTVDIADYPPQYDPDDPDQEVIPARNLFIRISLISQPYEDGRSFDHISNKTAVKIVKEMVKDLKENN